jgi:hypothetical protein
MRVAWKHYQPEDSPMQPTVGAGVFNKLLIATPFFLLASLGMKAETSREGFTFVACSSKENAKISAYAPFVKASVALGHDFRDIPAKTSRGLAYRWLAGAKVGLLQPLKAVAFEDNSRDGVKSEIVNANIDVSEACNELAEVEKEQHHWDQSAKDALLGASVLEVSKFFDFSSLSVCSMVQRRSLNTVAEEWPRLSKDVKAQILREALALRANDDTLAQMAMKARDELLQYEVRRGYDYRKLASTQKSIDVSQFHQPIPMIVKNLRNEIFNARDAYSPDFFEDLRLGYLSAMDTDRKIDVLLKAQNRVL